MTRRSGAGIGRALGPALLFGLMFAAGLCWAGLQVGELPAGIRLKGDRAFKKQALSALRRIQRTQTGARLFQEMKRASKMVTLRLGGMETSGAMMYPTGDGDCLILWDPAYELKGFPAFILLYHELIHALHEGNRDRDLPIKEEEKRTVGLESYADDPLTENALRRELKMPLRRSIDREEIP